MTSISKSAVVTYSADRMYELVNDVEAYPSFLPWCTESSILNRGEDYMTASISLAKGKIKQSFTTRNTMVPGRRIEVSLLKGPFKHLEGYWLFEPRDEHSCHIYIKMNFEFKNKLVKLALEKIFSHIINSLIESFTERADQVYGNERQTQAQD